MLFPIRKSIATLSFGLVAIAANVGLAQETAFRWKFTPGFKLRSKVTQEIEQGVPGSPQPVKQAFNLDQLWEVVSVKPDSSAHMRTTLERVVLTMDIPGAGEVALDTQKEPSQDSGLAAQVGGMFRPMIGVPCENDMATTGKISNVNIPDEAMVGFKNMPLGDSMSSVLTDSIEKGSPVFPDKAIAPGYSWTQNNTTKTPVGDMTSVNKLTYVGPETVNGRALHRFKMELTVSFNGANQLQAVIEIPEQNAVGSLLFDNEQGYLVSTQLDQSMKMIIKVAKQLPVETSTVQKTKTEFTPISGSKSAR